MLLGGNLFAQQLMSFEEASAKADEYLSKMSIEEKLTLTHGYRSFFFPGLPERGIPYVYLSDASQGVNIRKSLLGDDIVKQLDSSTAFPAPIMLAATFNKDMAYDYAKAIGEECRAGGVEVLLGPGLNIYRNARCGRNFEYFGEDPWLTSRITENYVKGMQSTGTVSCLKHFLGNQTEFYRRRSNSIISERAINEIYLPGFKAGIDAGAGMVMTAYNLLNGEWCGQSEYVIKELLRGRLGFKGGVMSDWTSITDWEKVIHSGQNIEMPGRKYFFLDKTAEDLYREGTVSEKDIEDMIRPMMAACIAFNLYDREKYMPQLLENMPAHASLARQVASEGVVLLKNEAILPLDASSDAKILLTGKFLDKIPAGLGSAEVKGYGHVTLSQALKEKFGDRLIVKDRASKEEIASYDVVILNVGILDSERIERYFSLPTKEEEYAREVVAANPNTVVIVNAGSAIRMTSWNDRAAAILFAFYPGQNGMSAVADVLSGDVNPSGKLPMTIEREFKDSPAFNTVPNGANLNTHGNTNEDFIQIYDVNYDEGVLVGYRWYESKNIRPLYPFGFGLSYTDFELSDMKLSAKKVGKDDSVRLSVSLKNTGNMTGAEVVQLYVSECSPTVVRPVKELKGFEKVMLEPGKKAKITFELKTSDMAFWDEETKDWKLNSGEYLLSVGTSSADIVLTAGLTVE